MSQEQIVITLDRATGQLNVTGPLTDKVLSYGMLEMAKEIVAGVVPEEAAPAPRLIPVASLPVLR